MAKNKNVAKVESNPKQVETSKHVDKEKAKRAKKRAATQIAKQAAKQVPKPTPNQEVGLLVTKELQNAIDACRRKVERIAKECWASNRKFRDIEFDLENDKNRCLYGLVGPPSLAPSDVHRVTQLFEKPQFFVDGASAKDIVTGALSDSWFLSALSTASTAPGLVEKFCVARDEVVGVYGFIFFRDHVWVPVIIDDMVFTDFPKYEALKWDEQQLYQFNKDLYNKTVRKGGRSFYFSSSGTTGETWVPLIEKAYAKLHGSFSDLQDGHACDAITDMTGGVSTVLQTKDLLNPERFWHEELSHANIDRLFGCSIGSLNTKRSGATSVMTVQGLIKDHAYSVLRAIECNGKKFVILRNPWGQYEWTGRWSDGSAEWTHEWLELLPQIGHEFGEDGQFIMEYSDWLECFERIDRTILFDSSWMLSSRWLRVKAKPLPAAWSYSDVIFEFTIPSASKTVVVLSQLDRKYYRDLAGKASWSMDFALVKQGETEPIVEVVHSEIYTSNVNAEVELEAGTYLVYVRLNRQLTNRCVTRVTEWERRKVSRIMMERAKSQSIALTFNYDDQERYLPVTLDELVEDDTVLYESEKHPKEKGAPNKPQREVAEDGTVTTTTTTRTSVETFLYNSKNGLPLESSYKPSLAGSDDDDDSDDDHEYGDGEGPSYYEYLQKFKVKLDLDDPNSVYVGLRVYTHKDVPVEIESRLG